MSSRSAAGLPFSCPSRKIRPLTVWKGIVNVWCSSADAMSGGEKESENTEKDLAHVNFSFSVAF